MCGLHSDNPLAVQIKLIRKYLKLKIMADNVSFRGHSQDRNHVYDLFKRTVVHGESHSALMIGPRGSGKTTVSAWFYCLYYNSKKFKERRLTSCKLKGISSIEECSA